MNDKEKKTKKSGELEVPLKNKVSKGSTINIMFRENRKFDLHIGRDVVTFKGRQSKAVPRSWITHSDFKSIQHLFVVKGV